MEAREIAEKIIKSVSCAMAPHKYDIEFEILAQAYLTILNQQENIEPTHEAADAFWDYWKENGETHKHGYYESTWRAINAALGKTGMVLVPESFIKSVDDLCFHCDGVVSPSAPPIDVYNKAYKGIDKIKAMIKANREK